MRSYRLGLAHLVLEYTRRADVAQRRLRGLCKPVIKHRGFESHRRLFSNSSCRTKLGATLLAPRFEILCTCKNSSANERFCAHNCGTRLKIYNVNYCSNLCKRTAYRSWLISTWKAGRLKARPFFNAILRGYIIETLCDRCQRCGWNERNPYSNRIPIEIEHIDGNWRNVAPENLTILCPNCHSLTATFRGLNRGHGRPGRPGLLLSQPGTTGRSREPTRPPEPRVSYLLTSGAAIYSEKHDKRALCSQGLSC